MGSERKTETDNKPEEGRKTPETIRSNKKGPQTVKGAEEKQEDVDIEKGQ